MSQKTIALLDACVLFPRHLRGFLIHLSVTSKLYHLKWTQKIFEEMTRNLVKKRQGMTEERASEIRDSMIASVPEAMIEERSFCRRIDGLNLPDKGDNHVLAAAISDDNTPDDEKVQVIVTNNFRHFPSGILEPHGLIAKSADDFVLDLCEKNIDGVLKALVRHTSFMFPKMSTSDVLNALMDSGLNRSSKLIRHHTS